MSVKLFLIEKRMKIYQLYTLFANILLFKIYQELGKSINRFNNYSKI